MMSAVDTAEHSAPTSGSSRKEKTRPAADRPGAAGTWRHTALFVAVLVAAIATWMVSLPMIDPRRLDDLGIVRLLPWNYWTALALLTVGFVATIARSARDRLLPGAYIVALIAVLHATPAIAYGTLRYSWAWKHIGVIDYIQRHDGIDRSATFLSAYHNWPGFFWIMAVIADALGWTALDIADAARFFPVVANLVFVALLVALYRRFTDDLRLAWAAVWIFLTASWIGQDYFSPQAVAYALHLLILVLVLGPLMPATSHALPASAFAPLRWLDAMRGRFARDLAAPVAASPPVRIAAAVVALLAFAAIAAIHQLTPLVMLFSLSALAVTTRIGLVWPLIAALVVALWVLYPAGPFTAVYLPGEIARLGDTLSSTTAKMVDTSRASLDVAIVAWAGRGLVATVGLLALLGGLRRLIGGRLDGVAASLLVAPFLILVATAYGGEAVFRVYFFALPFLAFFAAALFFPGRGTAPHGLAAASFAVVAGALAVGFLLANNGKDRQYSFTPGEVAAATWVYSRAAPGTLLVEGARNYPSQFMNYENFVYMPLANERPDAQAAILADPVATLDRWFADDRWSDGYVIITRSQKAIVDAVGSMPRGSLGVLEDALRAASTFQLVYANADAAVFRPIRFAGEPGAAP
jgi:hypothetical protein